MRIITGSKARMTILGPRDLTTRPITDRVKESVFSLIEPVVAGAYVSDLFCGTGSLGLEAISRGAVHAVMVEKDRDAVKRLRKNITKLGFEQQTTVLQTDVLRCAARTLCTHHNGYQAEPQRANIVFVDPPYIFSKDTSAQSNLALLLGKIAGQIVDRAIVVVRHSRRTELLRQYGQLYMYDLRQYGSMAVTLLEKIVD